jgi:putative phosphoribosyl transferase
MARHTRIFYVPGMNSFAQPFSNRRVAGIQLARAIQRRAMPAPSLVLGLPRGGVPVAYEIARTLHVPLDVMPVRKVGMPGNPEVAIGAMAGRTVVRDAYPAAQVPTQVFAELMRSERAELRRRERTYRRGLPPLNLLGMSVLLVDDGLATGCTMLAAVREARRLKAAVVVAAAPIASDTAEALVRAEADAVITLDIAVNLGSIGDWYDDFEQVTDSEVHELLVGSRLAEDPAPEVSPISRAQSVD